MSDHGHDESAFVPRRFVVAEFATPQALLDGTTKMREAGYKQLDTHTPFPIHGLEEALGLKRPKIPLIVLCGAIAGACHRVLADLLLQRVRLAAQHRQPAAARAAREHPDHVRAGGAAGRRVVVLRASSRWRGCPSRITRSSSRRSSRAASVDAFFLSVELPDGHRHGSRARGHSRRRARCRPRSSRSPSDDGPPRPRSASRSRCSRSRARPASTRTSSTRWPTTSRRRTATARASSTPTA